MTRAMRPRGSGPRRLPGMHWGAEVHWDDRAPHQPGCTALPLRRRHRIPVTPAAAGMNPGSSTASIGVPRPRWDAPQHLRGAVPLCRFAPRARGSTDENRDREPRAQGRGGRSPRVRGDAPQPAGLRQTVQRPPRARGDAPTRTASPRSRGQLAPRARGCTLNSGLHAAPGAVRPA